MANTEQATRGVYNSPSIVAHYAKAQDFQPAERAIFLSRLGNELASMKLLDIGIGGGRTTRYLAPLVAHYTGVDYAESMVHACAAMFGSLPNTDFQVADACELAPFAERSFDVVFFSFNGLDCIPPPRRMSALRAMLRVLRPGGFLAFSAHNSNYLRQHRRRLRPRLSRNPRRVYKTTRRYLLFQWKNRFPIYGPGLKEAFVFDGAEDFAIPLMYIRPDEQLRRLRELPIENVQLFGYDGAEIDQGQLETCQDPWIHYLCRKSGVRQEVSA